jgi:putative flippase GtrA
MRIALRELLRYVTIGSVSTAVDYGFYLLLTRVVGLAALTANPLSYLFGNVVSFYGHHFITFRSRGKTFPEYVRFLGVSVSGLVLSQAVIAVALAAGLPDLLSKAAAVVVSGLFNYCMNRYWTFSQKKA